MLIDKQKIQEIKRYVTEALNTIQPESFWGDFLLLVTSVECLQEEAEDLKAVSAFNAKSNKSLKRIARAAREYRDADHNLQIALNVDDTMSENVSAAYRVKKEKRQALFAILDEAKEA